MTIPAYTQQSVVVKFDDDIPDIVVPDYHLTFTDTDTIVVCNRIFNNEYEGAEGINKNILVEEIILDNAFFVFEAPKINPTLMIVLDCFPQKNKIQMIKATRALTGLGLKEAKDLVEDFIQKKNSEAFHDAANELCYEYREQPDEMGFINNR